jgi:hypothetical protein
MRFSVGPLTAQVFKIITSADAIEPACLYPACAKQPSSTAPSDKFVEQPKLFTSTRCVSHHDTLIALTRNKKIKVRLWRNLQKSELEIGQALKGHGFTYLQHI